MWVWDSNETQPDRGSELTAPSPKKIGWETMKGLTEHRLVQCEFTSGYKLIIGTLFPQKGTK